MGKKDKEKKPLTAYQKHMKKRASKIGFDAAVQEWRDKKGLSKPKSKQKVTTTTPKKKDTPKKRKRGPLEKKADEFKKELADIARALGVPVSKATIKVTKKSTTVRVGSIIRVKRAKLGEAMKLVRKRAKDRI